MPSRAATLPGVSAFHARPFTGRDYRRTFVSGAVLGLGGAGAAAMMAGTAAVAAAWMVSSLLSNNPEFRASMPITTSMRPRPEMRLAAPADMFGGALAAANPDYAPPAPDKLAVAVVPQAARGGELATATVPSAAAGVPLPQAKPRAVIASVPLPRARPMQFAEVQARLEAEARPRVVRVVTIAAAHSPQFAAPAPHSVPDGEAVAAPPARVAPRRPRRGEAVYGLASAEPAPATTASIGAVTKPVAAAAPAAPAKPAPPALAYANPDVPMRDNHTAIYDIVAHTVYMPDGERLEAHSGLGRMLDDPHYSRAKARGPTPPNVYDLTLRRGSFHGVQAIRLNPVNDDKMFGRDGILAHTYMLGPSGQSFGCVSFKHYDAFLRAFQRGEVNRMVVVPHLQEPPPGVRASAGSGERYASTSIENY